MSKIKLNKSEWTIKEEGKFTRYFQTKGNKKGIRLTSKFNKEFEIVDDKKKVTEPSKK